ncbi:MAG: hypothetical protein AAGI54_04645 [Planctomycetota bacterium]
MPQPANDVLAKVESALAERDARIVSLERRLNGYPRPVDWPQPPEWLNWPVHRVIELEPGEQRWPWAEFPRSAPAGTRIVIRPKRVTDDGTPQNMRPVIRSGVIRWGRGLKDTIVEVQDCVLMTEGNTVLFLGDEVNLIIRHCAFTGDYGETKDALNHQRMIGRVAIIDTRIANAAFGLRSVAYAKNVDMSIIADDGAQGTPIIEKALLSGLIRYTPAHPDGAELGHFKGLRWDGVDMRGIDGQGFAASSVTDGLVLNSSIDMASNFDAYAFAVHNLTDFWWRGRSIKGRVRITGKAIDSGFEGVDFESPELQIEAMARQGARFIDCTNNGEPIVAEAAP